VYSVTVPILRKYAYVNKQCYAFTKNMLFKKINQQYKRNGEALMRTTMSLLNEFITTTAYVTLNCESHLVIVSKHCHKKHMVSILYIVSMYHGPVK
jgi:hypothetical protein